MLNVKSTVVDSPGPSAQGVGGHGPAPTSSAVRIALSPPPGGSADGYPSESVEGLLAVSTAGPGALTVDRPVMRNCRRSTSTGLVVGKVPGQRSGSGLASEQFVSVRPNVTVSPTTTRLGGSFGPTLGSARVDWRMLLWTVGDRRLAGVGAPRIGLPAPVVASTDRKLKSAALSGVGNGL